MSKGSNRRPAQVPQDKIREQWEKIFGKKPVKQEPKKS